MTKIIIEQIKKDQIPEMVKIWNQHNRVLTDDMRKHSIESLNEWFETCHEINHRMFGLSLDNQLKAFMILHYEENEIRIKMTAVNNTNRNCGYGSRLLNFIIQEAREKDILTEVKVDNFETINICIKKGFEIIRYKEKIKEYILKLKI